MFYGLIGMRLDRCALDSLSHSSYVTTFKLFLMQLCITSLHAETVSLADEHVISCDKWPKRTMVHKKVMSKNMVA